MNRRKTAGWALRAVVAAAMAALYVVVMGVSFAYATDPYTDTTGKFKFTVTNGTLANITWAAGNDENLIIPSVLKYNGADYSVTSIGDRVFQGHNEIKSLTLPSTLKTIGTWAFTECRSLESVVIPEGVTEVGQYAFQTCTSLESAEIPSSITSFSNLSIFSGCNNLKNLTVSATLAKDGGVASYIGSDIRDRIKSVTIKGSPDKIGYRAFYKFSALNTVSIPDSVEEIGGEAFYGCKIQNNTKFPSKLTKIGSDAFGGGANMFTSVTLPDKLTEIGDQAFHWNSNLQKVVIPKSVNKIGQKAFDECSSPLEICYMGSKEEWEQIEGSGISNLVSGGNRITMVYDYKGSESGPSGPESGNTDPEKSSEKTDKDISDAFSKAHDTDGKDVAAGTVSSGNAKYSFDAEKSNTVVVTKSTNISKKFDHLAGINGFDASAKHRYSVDDKKIAKIDKKGNLKPKTGGEINIYLEQKVKGSGWTKIGDPVHLYIQKPEMQKKASADLSSDSTIDAYQYLSHTTYSPNVWKSSKPAVASVDEKGVITVHKKGSAKITAVYGEGKNSSGKKYTTKLNVK